VGGLKLEGSGARVKKPFLALVAGLVFLVAEMVFDKGTGKGKCRTSGATK
jgi:hypothetical protein